MFMNPEKNNLSVFKEIFYFSIYTKAIIREQNGRLLHNLERLNYMTSLLINKV